MLRCPQLPGGFGEFSLLTSLRRQSCHLSHSCTIHSLVLIIKHQEAPPLMNLTCSWKLRLWSPQDALSFA